MRKARNYAVIGTSPWLARARVLSLVAREHPTLAGDSGRGQGPTVEGGRAPRRAALANQGLPRGAP